MNTPQPRPVLGIPYAAAGVEIVNGTPVATTTCPACKHVSYSTRTKAANQQHAAHWARTHTDVAS